VIVQDCQIYEHQKLKILYSITLLFIAFVIKHIIIVNKRIIGNRYCTIQNFGARNFWQNSSQQKLANNILANAQNWVNITKHSLIIYAHEIICHRDITFNVSWSPAWSTCLVWRQWFIAITNISELVLNFVWAPRVLLVTIIRWRIQKFAYAHVGRRNTQRWYFLTQLSIRVR